MQLIGPSGQPTAHHRSAWRKRRTRTQAEVPNSARTGNTLTSEEPESVIRIAPRRAKHERVKGPRKSRWLSGLRSTRGTAVIARPPRPTAVRAWEPGTEFAGPHQCRRHEHQEGEAQTVQQARDHSLPPRRRRDRAPSCCQVGIRFVGGALGRAQLRRSGLDLFAWRVRSDRGGSAVRRRR